jgi:hypothetical protein
VRRWAVSRGRVILPLWSAAVVVDPLEWIALGLGALALGIAVWDNVRDQYFWKRRAGPVRVRCLRFEIPQPNVRPQTVGPPTSPRLVNGTSILIEWTFWNHVSWPVYVSVTFTHTLPPQSLLREVAKDELRRESEFAFFVPPRQPYSRTLWITVAEGAGGEIEPNVFVAFRIDEKGRVEPKTLRWENGLPVLDG